MVYSQKTQVLIFIFTQKQEEKPDFWQKRTCNLAAAAFFERDKCEISKKQKRQIPVFLLSFLRPQIRQQLSRIQREGGERFSRSFSFSTTKNG